MIWAYLMERGDKRIEKSGPYLASDPSEKTSISFYLGMTLTKLFADQLFNVPRVLHYAVYESQ
jgi:hypothetical protein